MSPHEPGTEEGAPLDGRLLRSLREAVGTPGTGRLQAAMDEVERQVVMEDLLILMVSGVSEATRAFFDLLVEVAPRVTGVGRAESDERGEVP